MVGADAAVGGTKRDAAGRAVGDEETVERVASPVESQSMSNKGRNRNVVNRESRVIHHGVREFWVANREPTDLCEKLDLQKGNRRDTPRAIPIDPRKFSKPFRTEDEPDQKVGVEKKCHRGVRRRETRVLSGPRHAQDHRSAFSALGTRRSCLYCRVPLAFLLSANSSRRSTRRHPLRCTAITSPSRASSRRRNQFFLASDAVTFFICTMYKIWRWGVKATFRSKVFLTHSLSQRARVRK
jgi:hypothetical protein